LDGDWLMAATEKQSEENPRLRNLKRGGSPGRPKGRPNKVTHEVRRLSHPDFMVEVEAIAVIEAHDRVF
jgi:enamine deaminase RidA (YjgF/YER057c/UK114 family)